MENASKALIIAGAVLIAMMILSIGVVLYNSYSDTSNRYNQTWSAQKIQKINSDYVNYIARTNISAEEIATCINCAKEHNELLPNPITVYIGTTDVTRKLEFRRYFKICER